MSERHAAQIAGELTLAPPQVRAVAFLLEDGATIPFIARYRKEATGSLDEVTLARIRDRLRQLANLDARRHTVRASLQKLGHLTPDLKERIAAAPTLATIEDLYLPFRPRRRTRATDAVARGLEPLARLLLEQDPTVNPLKAARSYVTPRGARIARELRVPNPVAALEGARDIIAARIADDATARAAIRDLFAAHAALVSRVRKGKERAGAKYRPYFRWARPLAAAHPHQIHAIFRGEKAGVLAVEIRPHERPALVILGQLFLKSAGRSPCARSVLGALRDAYHRLLAPSIETEMRAAAKQRADAAAIQVFARNLRQLLLAAPLGRKRVLAIDPGQRTGCKVAVLDPNGAHLAHAVIFPDHGRARVREAAATLTHLVQTHHVEAIAIGRGTAGRETETFVRSLDLPDPIPIYSVDESGASVYSTSAIARQELPHLDPTIRSAVSIGRRLIDPLAELVKINPKSIGVGQYQHDVDQQPSTRAARAQGVRGRGGLAAALEDVVISCVSSVGVDLNTASPSLLARVAGLGPATARAIVEFRSQHGPFKRRRDLLSVPGLGPRIFEQAAGFLRIPGATNPLDNTAVHPESYPLVHRMASDLGLSVLDLVDDPTLLSQINPNHYVTTRHPEHREGSVLSGSPSPRPAGPSSPIGLPTVQDILAELAQPGRDTRAPCEPFHFAPHVHTLADVTTGMTLPGIVTNVTHFGAFVDVGLHDTGLIPTRHLNGHSLTIHQPIHVTVEDMDPHQPRLSLIPVFGDASPVRQAPG